MSMYTSFLSLDSFESCNQVVITQPLEAAYYAALETASGGWHHQSRFASERVLGSFWETVEDPTLL